MSEGQIDLKKVKYSYIKMKHIIIDLHNRNLNDTDIDDEFLINNFDKNQHQEIFVDFSNNNLTEQSTIKILEHLSYLSKEVILLVFGFKT